MKDVEPDVKRGLIIKLRVNAFEKARIDEKRGNLPVAEFLRDRALYADGFYDPSIAAIGMLFQASGNLCRTCQAFTSKLSDIEETCDRFGERIDRITSESQAADLRGDLGSELVALIARAGELKDAADALRANSSQVANRHMALLMKRRAPTAVKPMKRSRK